MAELVATLATIEDRPWDQVLNDLAGPSGDVLRLRVAAADATLGHLPLDEGIRLLQGGRELLLAAACSTIRQEALHPQKKPREVTRFLERCRLGQTERGSFIATIIAPIPPEIQRTMEFTDDDLRLELEPYKRQVTTRLMSSLGLVRGAIDAGKPDRILDAVPQGISANLCEALDRMQPAGDQSSLDIGMSWVPRVPPCPIRCPRRSRSPRNPSPGSRRPAAPSAPGPPQDAGCTRGGSSSPTPSTAPSSRTSSERS